MGAERCGGVVRMGGLSACMDGNIPAALFATSILGSGMLLINHGGIISGGQLPHWWVAALTYGLVYFIFTFGSMYARLKCPACRNRMVMDVDEHPNPEQDISVMDYLANNDRRAVPIEEMTPRRWHSPSFLMDPVSDATKTSSSGLPLHYREEGDVEKDDGQHGRRGNGGNSGDHVKSVFALAHEEVMLDPPEIDIEMGATTGLTRVASGTDPRFSGSSGASSWHVDESLRLGPTGNAAKQDEFHESEDSIARPNTERGHNEEIVPCSSNAQVHWANLTVGEPAAVHGLSLEERVIRLHERGKTRESRRENERGKARDRERGSLRTNDTRGGGSRQGVEPEPMGGNELQSERKISRGGKRGRSRMRGSIREGAPAVSPRRAVRATQDIMVFKNSLFMEDVAVIDTYLARDKSPVREADVRSSSTVVSSTSFKKWLG